MDCTTADSLSAVPADAWDALAGGNVFTRHDFLRALETHDCLKPWGWQPVYFLIHDSGELVGACASYIKTNSYGEFVFDWAWADAYQRNGMDYYPKLVASIPFTPAQGPRLLAKNDETLIKRLLIEQMILFTEEQELSSAHWLFCEGDDHSLLSENLLTRIDYQYHWHNKGYADFDHFLSALSAKRRKNIRRERRSVRDENIDVYTVDGVDMDDEQWARLYDFYQITFIRKSGTPTFTLDFFRAVAPHLHGVFASHGGKTIAGAICYKNGSHLYGRHWGCYEHYDSLHFELCYYQGIEYCIRNGLDVFEPGAQGEHKIWRGFLPTETRSAHYIAHPGFREVIEHHLQQEHRAMQNYGKTLEESSPYRCGT